jgi:RNase P subunit RPR2
LPNLTEKKPNHPKISFLIGFVILMLTGVVSLGVLHHFGFSHHGPELLKPLKEKYFTRHESAVLEEARRLEELEIHRHFHNIVKFPQPSESQRPACYICHSDLPHGKNKKIRSLLNMHTQYLVCETCHIKEKENTTIVYRWYNPLGDSATGPFFGTRYDPVTVALEKVEDLISKIAPYFRKDDKFELTVQIQSAPLARDYLKVRDELTPEQRDIFKMKFHGNIKPRGHECEDCHAKKGLLDFKELGFAENRIEDLRQLNIRGMITKYEEFFLPTLFK